MESRDWKILKVLYEEKNITKTARRLYVSQPTMTKRLQQIENEFSVEIVQRTKFGVHFTPQGEYLARCADHMLQQMQKIHLDLDNMKDSIEGTVRIGASNFILQHKLPSLLGQFKKRYPKVNFEVKYGWSSDVFHQMLSQEIQIAFVQGKYDWKNRKELFLEETMCVVSAEPIDLKNLPNLPRVEYYKDNKLEDMINAWWWENYDVSPNICMKVGRLEVCREMVLEGMGYAILPSLVIEQEKGLYRIEMKEKDGAVKKRETWMFYHEDMLKLKAVEAFIAFVRQSAQNREA